MQDLLKALVVGGFCNEGVRLRCARGNDCPSLCHWDPLSGDIHHGLPLVANTGLATDSCHPEAPKICKKYEASFEATTLGMPWGGNIGKS